MCKSYSVRMCFDMLLNNIKVRSISCACAKKLNIQWTTSNQANTRNTKQHIVKVYQINLEKLWFKDNSNCVNVKRTYSLASVFFINEPLNSVCSKC